MSDEAEMHTVLFNRTVTPLLKLISHLTGLETAFVTLIDQDMARQQVLLAVNTGNLNITSGAEVEWPDSMCQLMFSQQLTSTDQLSQLFPNSKGVQLGMQSFVVLPIKLGEKTIGTLCGADTQPKKLSSSQHVSLQLIAESLSLQLQVQLDAIQQRNMTLQAQHSVNLLQGKVQDLSDLANSDPLTELLNRRGFKRKCDDAENLCARSGMAIAIMIMDIDNFKRFNDQHGHEQGDDIIRLVADGIRQVARTTDILCRLGGDEFVLAALDTDSVGMTMLAERLVNYIQRQSDRLALQCTLSIGITSSRQQTVKQLMKTADQALYQSKAAGRNTTTVL